MNQSPFETVLPEMSDDNSYYLYCLIFGDQISQIFPILVKKHDTAGVLRDAIKKANETSLAGVDAKQLHLWHVNIPAENLTVELDVAEPGSIKGAVQLEHPLTEVPSPPTNCLRGHLHIIVQRTDLGECSLTVVQIRSYLNRRRECRSCPST